MCLDTISINKKGELKIETTRINQDCIIDISSGSSNTNGNYYISIDMGKKNCEACITDKKDGSIIEETKFDNTICFVA